MQLANEDLRPSISEAYFMQLVRESNYELDDYIGNRANRPISVDPTVDPAQSHWDWSRFHFGSQWHYLQMHLPLP